MKQVNFKKIENSHLDEIKNDKLKIVKNNESFQEFIALNSLTNEEILNNISKFLKVLSDRSICENCQDLKRCEKYPKGKCLDLEFDDDNRLINLVYFDCEREAIQHEYEIQYLIKDFPNENLEYEFKEIANPDYFDCRKNMIAYLSEIILKDLKKGIFLTGSRRCGKTFALSLFSKAFIKKYHQSVAFVDSSKIFKNLNDLYFTNKEEMEQLFDKLCDVDLLVIDDFGNEFKNEYIRDLIVYPLLNSRLINNKLTCFSSSYTIEEISQMYQLRERESPKARLLKEVISELTREISVISRPFIRGN